VSEIDWSKAPEGYPVWVVDRSGALLPGWHKESAERYTDCNGSFWSKDDGGFVAHHQPPTPTWNDEGLPPVGTVCNLSTMGRGNAVVKVMAYADHSAHGKSVMFEIVGGVDDGGMRGYILECCSFSPIRTPEQIAAEEREAAIDELKREFTPTYDWMTWQIYDTIYVLEYRKP
jgi:hypothetical protein